MNPWLTIPLDEYEAHMALPAVDQATLMADILASICETYRPPSLALLGCAGGLGLDRVNPAVVSRIVAIDINGAFAERARERYARRFHAFSAFVADIERDPLPIVPVRLAIGSLVFEYVDPGTAMRNVRALIERGGMLVRVAGTRFDRASKARLMMDGREGAVEWHITADANHGPEIPCMAAILMARKLARGEIAARGAYPCMGFLRLEEFEPEFRKWGMTTEIRDEG